MTINSTTRKAGPFIGNGSTTSFPFTYKVFQASDLAVVRLDTTTNVETVLTLTSDYTVTLNLDQDSNPGGTVVLVAGPLAAGYTLTMTSDVPNLQPTDLTNQGGFYPDVINDALDRATIQIQQLQEQTDRSLKLAISSTADSTLPAPNPNDLIGWDATGENLINVDPGSIATVVAYATAYCDVFIGNGITTSWTLLRDPAVLYNLDVSINGSTQEPTRDYTLSGTTFTMTTPPPIGSRVVVKYKEGLPNYEGDSQDVRFVPAGASAVTTSVQSKLRESVSVIDFGAVGDGDHTTGSGTDNYAAFQNAYNYCRANGLSLHIPAGNYRIAGQVSWATGPVDPATGLHECNNVTVYGDGDNTIVWTDWPAGTGADVIQVNLCQNITFKDFAVTSRITTNLGAGSNGVSITGGFDNVNVDNVYAFDLPYVETTVLFGVVGTPVEGQSYTNNGSTFVVTYYGGGSSVNVVRTSGTNVPSASGTMTGTASFTYTDFQQYPDGGKGVTFQTGDGSSTIGSSWVKTRVKNCAFGVGFDGLLDGWESGKPQVRVEAIVERCYIGFEWSFVGLTSPEYDNGFTSGVVANITATNCQRPVYIGRAYGMVLDAMIVTTESKANLRLNPGTNTVSQYWLQNYQEVIGFTAQWVKNCTMNIEGYLNDTDYKIRIGDANEAYGGTNNSNFYFNLGGSAASVKNVDVVNVSGSGVQNCEIVFSNKTTAYSSDLDMLFYPAWNNTVTVNQKTRFISPTVQGKLGFAYTDGVTVYNEMERDGLGMFLKQTGGTGGDIQVMGVKNHTGAKKFAIRNDGGICTEGTGSATSVSGLTKVIAVYNASNTFIGWLPLYTTAT